MKKFIALMLCLLISSAAFAEAKQQPDEEPDPASFPILEKLKGNDKNLTYDYLGNRVGVDAWLLTGPNIMQIVYLTPGQDNAMVGGALVGPDGKEISSDLTKEFMAKYPKRAQEILITVRSKQAEKKPEDGKKPASEVLWDRLQQGGKITFGSEAGVPVIYVILDPSQSVTKDVWAVLGPIAKENKITLHILPLALTSADSIVEIASVLGNENPQAAWEKILAGESLISETPQSSGVLGMKANVDLATSLSLRHLPFFVYRATDEKIRILRGVPKDWTAFLGEMNVK